MHLPLPLKADVLSHPVVRKAQIVSQIYLSRAREFSIYCELDVTKMLYKTRIQSSSILIFSKNVMELRLRHNLSCAYHDIFSSGRLSKQTGQQ